MHFELRFGDASQGLDVPDRNVLAVVRPNSAAHAFSGEASVRDALEHPIASPRLRDLVRGKTNIAVISSDITRPMPTWEVMPPVLDELYAGGARPENIRLIFALGSHRHQTEEERRRLAGERAWAEIACMDSNSEDVVHLGVTSAGTPVNIDRAVAEADLRVCLGNIEFHYFAGYSGGGKALMPGCSSPAAIQANHRMMTDERARAGSLEDNPVRKDIEESAAMVGADFIVNCVLDEAHEILYTAAGDAILAHRNGCAFLDRMYRIRVPRRADIVVVSQGGAPKDLNLYQTQKALDNARLIVRDGGMILLVGSCREGTGNAVFEDWLVQAQTPEDILKRLHSGFRLGGHKAAAVALAMRRAEICLVSEMDPDLVRNMFFTPFASLQEAMHYAMAKKGADASVILMPYGGSTLPEADA